MIESSNILDQPLRHTTHSGLRLGVINAFIALGLLHLTNLSYYLSQALGFETEVNNTGGNAVQFANYIGIGLLLYALLAKIKHAKLNWSSAKLIYTLIVIYAIAAALSPYNDPIWTFYQILFLLVALILHFLVQKVGDGYDTRFQRGTRIIFYTGLLLSTFCGLMIATQNSVGYYLQEFNEVFVHTLDDFGIMKQLYGYLLGFLVSYTLFIIRGIPKKALFLSIILFTGFGIRSFMIGMLGAIMIYTVQTKSRLIVAFGLGIIGWFGMISPMISELVYDTRFYAYANAFDIVQKFPFGVGLGGYHVYTEEHSRELFANLFDINAVLDYIPLAPESDIVFLFGSLGLVLGGLHLLIQGRIIYKIHRTVAMQAPFQKCLLFYFTFMTFFGISEDSMFSINYWIFFGLASGITYQLFNRYKLER